MATPQKPEAGTSGMSHRPKAARPSQPSAQAEKKSRKEVFRRRTTCSRQLYKEINRWRKLKISESLCMKLTQVYLGDPEFLDVNGVYPLHQIYQLACKYYSKHSVMLVNLLGQSGSFRFICNTEKTVCYGFYPTWTADEHVLESYLPEPNDFNQLDVQSGAAPISRCETPPYNNYCILSSINLHTMQIPTPPSEGTRLPGSCTRGDLLSWSDRRDLMHLQTQAKPQPNYGSAADFFHQLNTTEHGRNTVLEPLRQRIMKRFHLDRIEAGIVLVQVVKAFLIPLFDRSSEFPKRPYGGRVAWLKAILQKQYFTTELEHAFRDAQDAIGQYRNQQELARHSALSAFRPLSAFEWTHPQTGQRYYRDPDDGVIDLPSDAPARPTATARWNAFTREWTDEEAPTTAPASAEETDSPAPEETDYEAIFGYETEEEEAGENDEKTEEETGEGGEP